VCLNRFRSFRCGSVTVSECSVTVAFLLSLVTWLCTLMHYWFDKMAAHYMLLQHVKQIMMCIGNDFIFSHICSWKAYASLVMSMYVWISLFILMSEYKTLLHSHLTHKNFVSLLNALFLLLLSHIQYQYYVHIWHNIFNS